MSGTTTGGGPPHNPVQNPPPEGVSLEDVLESFEHLKSLLLAYLSAVSAIVAESRLPAPPAEPPHEE